MAGEKAKYWCSMIAEHVLFAVSVFAMIPPVMSNDGDRARYLPAAVVIAIALFRSRVLAMRRGAEIWLGILLKVLVLVVAGWLINIRVFEYA